MRSTFDDPSFISVSFKKAIECEAKKQRNCEPSLCSCDVSAKRRKNNVTVKCTSIKCLFRFFFVIIRCWECDKEEMIRTEDIKCGAWRDVAKIYCKNMNYEGSRRKGMDFSIHLLPVPKRHHRPQLLLHNSETNSSVIDQKAGAAWMRRSIIHWVRVEWSCHACERQNGRLVNKGSCLKVKCESLLSQKAFQKRLKAFLFVLSVRKIDFRRSHLLLSRQDDERDVPLSLHFRTFVMQFHRKRC